MSHGTCCTFTAISALDLRYLISCGLVRSFCSHRPPPSTGGRSGERRCRRAGVADLAAAVAQLHAIGSGWSA